MSLFRKLFGLPPKHLHDWGMFGEVMSYWSQHYSDWGEPDGPPHKIYFQNRKCNTCGLLESKRLN